MQKNLVQHPVRWALAAVMLATLTATATAGSITRRCVARDMQILMLIEERISANAISAQRLTDAMGAMTHARMVCHNGDLADALALYDVIADGLVSISVRPGRIR